MITERDIEAFLSAGFKVQNRCPVRYCEEEFAKQYIQSGFKPRADVEFEAVFALTKMALPAGGTVWDIGCGNGISALKMAEMGFNIGAVDISPVFIEEGKRLQKERNLPKDSGAITWICGDFFDISPELHDAAILLDSGIDVTNRRFVDRISQFVRPNGFFFLRYKQAPSGQPRADSWSFLPESGKFRLERFDFDQMAGNSLAEWVTIDLNNKEIIIEQLESRAMVFADFVQLMSCGGFALEDAWGDAKGSPVTRGSRIYALFRKLPG